MSGVKKIGEVVGFWVLIDIIIMVGDVENIQFKLLGIEVMCYNVLKYGILFCYIVLFWENVEEYEMLLSVFIFGYNFSGLIEEYFVEELVGIMWLKQCFCFVECVFFQIGFEWVVELYNGVVGVVFVYLYSGK